MDFGNVNLPADVLERLIIREQNLRFVNYCPSCDNWMKVVGAGHFECSCGLKRDYSTAQLVHSYQKS